MLLLVILAILLGFITDNPILLIIGYAGAFLGFFRAFEQMVHPLPQDKIECTNHKWTKSVNETIYCEKCGKRPNEDTDM